MVPELRSLTTTASDDRAVPDDPTDCRVSVTAVIGPRGAPGEELFRFSVVTPIYLTHASDLPRWGRGMLIVDEFSWSTVERMVHRLLARFEAESWQQVAALLCKELEWEFDGYEPSKA